MNILSIETSCDETAVSIIEANGGLEHPHFKILGNVLFSQIEIHREYGGVFPMLAKREHAKNLPALLAHSFKEAKMYNENGNLDETVWMKLSTILLREEGLCDGLKPLFGKMTKPQIDIIAVTVGPGLEPALWVGISCAKALGTLWDIPVVPTNHMEGHIVSVLAESEDTRQVNFPALALLVSGGHTELVSMPAWGQYKTIGQTRDDAVGEAFDKVARQLGLPYPGGPEISKLAHIARTENIPQTVELPRPMINSNDCDFSFSGLKTAVLYYIRDHEPLSENDKADIAREFEDATVEVLMSKTKKALDLTGARTLIIGGGVIANKKLRDTSLMLEKEYPDLIVKTPTHSLSTDNALMVACAAYMDTCLHPEKITSPVEPIANGNLKLG